MLRSLTKPVMGLDHWFFLPAFISNWLILESKKCFLLIYYFRIWYFYQFFGVPAVSIKKKAINPRISRTWENPSSLLPIRISLTFPPNANIPFVFLYCSYHPPIPKIFPLFNSTRPTFILIAAWQDFSLIPFYNII